MSKAKIEHPGAILRRHLEETGTRSKDFAAEIGMYATHFSNLLNGKRHISDTLALTLEKNTPWCAEDWLWWQIQYDLAQCRKDKKVRRRIK